MAPSSPPVYRREACSRRACLLLCALGRQPPGRAPSGGRDASGAVCDTPDRLDLPFRRGGTMKAVAALLAVCLLAGSCACEPRGHRAGLFHTKIHQLAVRRWVGGPSPARRQRRWRRLMGQRLPLPAPALQRRPGGPGGCSKLHQRGFQQGACSRLDVSKRAVQRAARLCRGVPRMQALQGRVLCAWQWCATDCPNLRPECATTTLQIQQVKEVSPPEATAMLEQIASSVDGMATAAWDVSPLLPPQLLLLVGLTGKGRTPCPFLLCGSRLV